MPIEKITELSDNLPMLSVSELLQRANGSLKKEFSPSVTVVGELLECKPSSKGHLYFSLRDRSAPKQVRCAYFRASKSDVEKMKDGAIAAVTGRMDIYEASGSLSLIASSIGVLDELGLLHERFEIIKKKLIEEGLFDREKKRLPALPRVIGIVTSPTGAAVRDSLLQIRARMPSADVVIYPTSVQGATAHLEIAQALRRAAERNECEALILCRGGGSAEDLWCFNEEEVSRAVAAMPMPVITGVGHEPDVSICDYVADVRAATPTHAAVAASANLASIDRWRASALRSALGSIEKRLDNHRRQIDALDARLGDIPARARQAERAVANIARELDGAVLGCAQNWRLKLNQRQSALLDPGAVVKEKAQRLLWLRSELDALPMRMAQARGALRREQAALSPAPVQNAMAYARKRLFSVESETQATAAGALQKAKLRLKALKALLEAQSPESILGKGYCFAADDAGRPLTGARRFEPGQCFNLRLKDGSVSAQTLSVKTNAN